MREISTGKLIQSTREAQRLTSAELIDGICSRRTLMRLETGQTDCDMLLFAVLLQRLGKSPDKLEYIFSWEEYRKECIRTGLSSAFSRRGKNGPNRRFRCTGKKRKELEPFIVCISAAAVPWLPTGLTATRARRNAGWRRPWMPLFLTGGALRWRSAAFRRWSLKICWRWCGCAESCARMCRICCRAADTT